MNVLLPNDPYHRPVIHRRAHRRMSTGSPYVYSTACSSNHGDGAVIAKLQPMLAFPTLSWPTSYDVANHNGNDNGLGRGSGSAGSGSAGTAGSGTHVSKKKGSNSAATAQTKLVDAAPGTAAHAAGAVATASDGPPPTLRISPKSDRSSTVLGGIAVAASIGGGSVRSSLHKLFRSPSSMHRTRRSNKYVSIDSSDWSCCEIDALGTPKEDDRAAAITPPGSPLKTPSGRPAKMKLLVCNDTPTTILEGDSSSSSNSSLTDGYDGFAAGSLHSNQQQQPTEVPASPVTPPPTDKTPFVRRQRRSSMPMLMMRSGSDRGDPIHAHQETNTATSTIDSTTWVHSPGAAKAHLELRISPEKVVAAAAAAVGDHDTPETATANGAPRHPQLPPSCDLLSSSSSSSSSSKGCNSGTTDDEVCAAPVAAPAQHLLDANAVASNGGGAAARSARLRHRSQVHRRRRHSIDGGGGGYTAGGGGSVEDAAPDIVAALPSFATRSAHRSVPMTVSCASSSAENNGAQAESSGPQSPPLTPSPSSILPATSPSDLTSTLPSPRRKASSRRTATARHLTSRRRTPSMSTTSPNATVSPSLPLPLQHLQVPVV